MSATVVFLQSRSSWFDLLLVCVLAVYRSLLVIS